ncbi:bifunctional lysylphosphatidylglycerol flippase/synthetase MprF [Camelliibacillus cellulosilyticus]|uniref:Phosphatidylglycerol lysyltransferase n=1 Tax=Camelliibacillus cellulosilyticus TaxID=2174486 RepID=A0ABV9GJA8_9BACL
MFKDKAKHYFKFGKFLIPIILILIIYYEGKQQLAGFSLKQSFNALKELPSGGFALVIVTGLVAVSVMSFYDFVLIRSLKLSIPVTKIFRIGWIANTFNSVIGFGGLAGAGMRTTLYREHTTDMLRLIKSIAWMTPSMITGLSVLLLGAFAGDHPFTDVLDGQVWLWVALIGVALIAPTYLIYAALRKTENVKFSTSLKYVIVSAMEWAAAAFVLYTILFLIGVDLSFSQVLNVFVVAAVMGLISLIPGGFGSFDLMFLIGIQAYDVQKGTILTALLLYRIVYYFIPFIIGLMFTIVEMSKTVMKKLEDNQIITPAIETTGVLWTLQRQLWSRVGYFAFSLLLLCSSLWIFLNVTIQMIMLKIDHTAQPLFFPKPIMYLFYALLLGIALILLFLVNEIYYRTKLAYYMTCLILLVGSLIALLTLSLSIIPILLTILLVLFLQRSRFTRISRPFSFTSGLRMLLLSIIAMWIYVEFIYLTLDLLGQARKVGSGYYTVGFIALFFSFLYVSLFITLFGKFHKQMPGEAPNRQKLKDFLHQYGGHVLSHLGFLCDKRFFFSEDQKAMLLFSKVGKRLIVLGDPFGEPASFPALLEAFHRAADQFGYYCVFYQIQGGNMAMYHDIGYRFFKLGEEAVVNLDTFTISGKKNAGLRATFNRFEREGYTFSVQEPPFTREFLEELQAVSDAWIGKKKEKGFSIGHFNEQYLSQAPIAVLSNASGDIIAFMNLMPVYQPGGLSVDLMRYMPDAPSGVMDAMFIHLFNWAKEKDYRYFNMGMAPLSNVGLSAQAFLSERIAAAIFNNINYMYSFRGLRQFKNKYHPDWTGKYLAFRKNRSLPGSMLVVTRLIGKKRNK